MSEPLSFVSALVVATVLQIVILVVAAYLASKRLKYLSVSCLLLPVLFLFGFGVIFSSDFYLICAGFQFGLSFVYFSYLYTDYG